jgi:hypothetical protein
MSASSSRPGPTSKVRYSLTVARSYSSHDIGGGAPVRYNWLGGEQYTVAAANSFPSGKATITFDFTNDGGGFGKGGTGTISVNGTQVAEGKIDKTQAFIFSGDETADVGRDTGTPVSAEFA